MDQNPSMLAEQGKKEYASGKFAAAANLFSQAAQGYEFMQDGLNAAEMKNNQSVALLQAGNAKRELQAVEGTEDIFQKAGDIKRQGIAVSNRAAALEGLKNGARRWPNMTAPLPSLNRLAKATCTRWRVKPRRI